MFSATLLHAVLPDRYRRVLVLAFFSCLLAGGLGLVRDYGVSFDEGTQRVLGQVSLLYVFQQLPTPIRQRLPPPGAPAAERARLVLEPNLAQADYALYPYEYWRPAPFPTPCHSVQAGQMRLLDVFCLRPTPTPSPRAANRVGE